MAEKRETLNARVTRLKEKHTELADIVKILMPAQIKTEEQFRETYKRIQTLVSAISEPSSRIGPLPTAK
jgi:predicted  nucleic acid-binding Zn-ribbon protein